MTITTSITPADPESAALELLVQSAEAATGSTAFRAVLQDLAGALHVEGALAGLAWVDARLVAGAVSFDACTCADPVGSLRRRGARRPRSSLRRLRRRRPGARRRCDRSRRDVSGPAPGPLPPRRGQRFGLSIAWPEANLSGIAANLRLQFR
jgi:hypothetical protein